jgi:hypothetical protein
MPYVDIYLGLECRVEVDVRPGRMQVEEAYGLMEDK